MVMKVNYFYTLSHLKTDLLSHFLLAKLRPCYPTKVNIISASALELFHENRKQ